MSNPSAAQLKIVADAIEDTAGITTATNANPLGYWKRIALAAEAAAGASTTATDTTVGYMLRAATALESIAGTTGDEENRNPLGLLKRIVDALEGGVAGAGSLANRLAVAGVAWEGGGYVQSLTAAGSDPVTIHSATSWERTVATSYTYQSGVRAPVLPIGSVSVRCTVAEIPAWQFAMLDTAALGLDPTAATLAAFFNWSVGTLYVYVDTVQVGEHVLGAGQDGWFGLDYDGAQARAFFNGIQQGAAVPVVITDPLYPKWAAHDPVVMTGCIAAEALLI